MINIGFAQIYVQKFVAAFISCLKFGITLLPIWLSFQATISAEQQEDIAKLTGYRNATASLKQVMDDYGFKQEKEKLAVLLLLKLNDISLPNKPFDGLESANEWLRESTRKMSRLGERWLSINTIKENDLKKKGALVRLAAEWLGMRQAIMPNLKPDEPFLAILPGAREERVRKRIRMLMEHMCVAKIKPTRVILAAGERKLNETECIETKGMKERNEIYMCEVLWKELGNSLPYDTVISLKRKLMPRATTEDNATAVAAFLKNSPIKKIVIYEEQPFVRRCRTIFTKTLGGNFEVEVYSIPMPDEGGLFLYQDEIAGIVKFLYPSLKAQYNAQKIQRSIAAEPK